MTLFFYGQDTYCLKQKVKALKEKFISSSLGDTNLVVLDGKTVTFDETVRQILAMPFLSKKRLVIISNLLKDGQKGTQDLIADFLKTPKGSSSGKVPESTVLVFVEEGLPDRRSALFRKLNIPGQAQEFRLLEKELLKRWIKKEVLSRGGTIDNAAVDKLAEFVGSDLWRMSNEIAKLSAFSLQLTVQNIDILVQSQIQANIFALIEATAAKTSSKAIQELYKLFQTGNSEIYILTMIIYQYRNLLLLKDVQERFPRASKWELIKKTNLHPYVLTKTLALTCQYRLWDLKKIYEKILDFESSIKIGRIEPRIALELLVFELTR